MQTVTVNDRKNIVVTGVNNVVGFDSQTVVVDTENGRLTIMGSELSVSDLSVENGQISANGNIDMLKYSKTVNNKGVLNGLFK